MIPDVPVQAPPLVVNQLHSEEHGLLENELIAHASHELLSIKTHYISIYIFYILFISRQVQEFKNYQNTSSTSKVINKTSLTFWKKYYYSLYFI